MGRGRCLLGALMLLLATSSDGQDAQGGKPAGSYRLPQDVLPRSYLLKIETDLDNFIFTGVVDINVECMKETSRVTLHSNQLEVEAGPKGAVLDKDGNQAVGSKLSLEPKSEFLHLELDSPLKAGQAYCLSFKFKGNLTDDLAGYYKSSYTDRKTNQTRWIGSTQFEATDARRAFPCFDEPAMKANFTIQLAHKDNLKAASNMPLIATKPYEGRSGWVWSQFEESVPMSTYLVAWLVSDFEYRSAPPRPNNVTFRIWSREDALPQTELAAKVGPEVLEYFEEYFQVKYPLPKQDMAAIPDFSAGAMENWGLITYRETALLFDEKSSSREAKSRVAYVIAHELAHQWFGNLVTMSWWTDLWLNEGFATYVGTLGVEKLFPEWGYLDESVLDFARAVYELDSLKSSHPVSVEIKHASEISQIFDTISYKKGCFILRMMHMFLGDSFRNGVTNYLNKHRYGNAEQDDLWAALTEEAHRSGELEEGMSVKEVMDSWTLQTGYPIIRVVRDYAKGTASLEQERYLQVRDGSEKINQSCWWVPITYTTGDKPEFNESRPQLWLDCRSATPTPVTLTGLPADSWLLLNLNISGLYRVKYDDKNWEMISNALNSDNYKKISVLNRADLLLTAFDLAKTGELSYDQAFQLASYLVHETDYLPWANALRKLGELDSLLERTPTYGQFKELLSQMMSNLYKKYNDIGATHQKDDEAKLHRSVSGWAVRLGLGSARDQAHDHFYKWYNSSQPDEENPVSVDVRKTVYCWAVKNGQEKEWNFLWERYLASNVASERSIILYALGCTDQIWLLNRYLEWSIDNSSQVRKQDSTSIFHSISSRNIGFYVACDFFQRKIKDIFDYHSGKSHRLGSYVEACGRSIIFEDEYNKWKDWLERQEEYLKDAKLAVHQSLEAAKANVDWHKKHYENINIVLQHKLHKK